ncbi:nucleotidyltransferase family protein [Paracidovorax oryzae]|uniref:nucleotidyltransferase family protein n=1 Tax=Paracidovorax oryzae TaxID=862720 RepID=UPI001ED96FBA|nr:nucleotidyltransferase family protein [Paracidovorax oryzae]
MSDRGLRTEAPGVALSCRPWRTPRQRTYGRSSRPASGFRSGQTILSISWPPHGLEDLFALRVRHNPVRASAATYRQRVEQKRYAQRWPRVEVIPAEESRQMFPSVGNQYVL